jgi:hypothetical protein
MAATGVETGFLLDRRWHWMKGGKEKDKKAALVLLARVLDASGTAYAIVGGVALQVHHPEPRTTLDIDVAVADRQAIPRHELEKAGFQRSGSYAHSESWTGPDATPVQFTDDPALAGAVARADQVELHGVKLRVIRRVDLLHEKLRSGSDPGRRRSKRLQDLTDAQALLESDPSLFAELTEAERAILDQLPR